MLFFTTVFKGNEFEPRIRRKPASQTAQNKGKRDAFGDKHHKILRLPSIAAAYNDQMCHVDTANQLRVSQRYVHRLTRGGWKALAWTFLLETIVVNSFKLQSSALGSNASWKPYEPQSRWREHLRDALCEAYGKSGGSRKRYRSGDTFTPVIQHNRVYRGVEGPCLACRGLRFDHIRSRSSKRRALEVISGSENTKKPAAKKIKKTMWGCDRCDVAICSSDVCWDFYHAEI